MTLKTYELPATFIVRARNEREARDEVYRLTTGITNLVDLGQVGRGPQRVYFSYSTANLRRITWPRRNRA